MTRIEDVFGVLLTDTLDFDLLRRICASGYTRIPVFANEQRHEVVGLLSTKDLILLDPEDGLSAEVLLARCLGLGLGLLSLSLTHQLSDYNPNPPPHPSPSPTPLTPLTTDPDPFLTLTLTRCCSPTAGVRFSLCGSTIRSIRCSLTSSTATRTSPSCRPCYLLPTFDYLLLTAYCLLPTTYHLLARTTYR